MIKLKRYKKAFWVTLFWKQNKYHKHGVFLHTLKVTLEALKTKNYKMIPASLLHDIGKPFVAYQKPEDKILNEYSFTNHEEISWYLIKDWPISNYTKNLVRWHYLIRDIKKSKAKGNFARYNRLRKVWDKLDNNFKDDLRLFLKLDDKGKE